jgi:type IV/VI secretion system ImpK/VasF family protein
VKTQKLSELAAPLFVCLCVQAERAGTETAAMVEPLDVALKDFQRNALLLLGDAEAVGEACYLLSTAADEWMLKVHGMVWTRHSMLVRHYGDAHGGERCWQTLDLLMAASVDALSDTQRQLLELYELAVTFGWRGRLRLLPDGEEQVHSLRVRLHEILRAGDTHAAQTRQLVAMSTQHLDRRQSHLGGIAIGIAAIGALAALLFVEVTLNQQWADLTVQLNRAVGAVPLTAPERQP